MVLPAFLKKKSTYIVLVAVLIVGGLLYRRSHTAAQPQYETASVARQNLAQTVEVTGSLKPAARIELAFRNSGVIGAINVQTGDKVKKGDILAELKDGDARFAVANARAGLEAAQANLNARLAGETAQSIRVAETQVTQAEASLQKATADRAAALITTSNSVKAAEDAANAAKHNLDNSDAIVTQTLTNASESTRNALVGAIGPLQTALTDGDQFSGVDNTAQQQMYLPALGALDTTSIDRARTSYTLAKSAKAIAEQAVNTLGKGSTNQAILDAATKVQSAISLELTYLTDVQRLLTNSMTSVTLTAADLAAKKALIDTDRATLTAQNTAVTAAIQTTKNSDLTRQDTLQKLQDAYTAALTALDSAKANAASQMQTVDANVAIQKAAVEGANAALDQKRSGPRAVDVAGLRANVEQARVAYEKALNDIENIRIIAPTDGTIATVAPDEGELAIPNTTAITMVGTTSYDIEALVPEADVSKVTLGQSASTTLDAFGDDVVFRGSVSAEDPDQTKVQDAVYYKIRVQIDPEGRDIKPGMTANVTVQTGLATNVLVIPLRAVKTTPSGEKTVRVLQGKNAEIRTVQLGLRGDEGRVEVQNGLNENDTVIVSETTK